MRAGAAPSFAATWRTGYTHPLKLVDAVATRPAPHTGVYAQLLRAALDSLLVYLPVALMGRIPPEPPYLRLIPEQHYYAALIGLGPLVLLGDLLLTTAFVHVLVRMLGYPSQYDQVINLAGMSALIVGAALIPWDWFWFLIGGVDQIFLGISHLVISLWAVVIMVAGLHRLFRVPVWLGILVSALSMPVGMILRIMFMRAPF